MKNHLSRVYAVVLGSTLQAVTLDLDHARRLYRNLEQAMAAPGIEGKVTIVEASICYNLADKL